MRLLAIWGGLLLTLASAASAQDLQWERVGATPHSFSQPPDWAPDGTLWASGRGGVYNLALPYDSTASWSRLTARYAGSPVLALGQDTVLVFRSSVEMARTTNGGVSFTHAYLEGGTDGAGIAIPFGLSHGGTLVVPGTANATSGRYGGFSRDRGASWTSSTIPGHDGQHPRVQMLVVVPRGPHAGRILAAGQWGISLSDDGGATYASVPPWWGQYRFEGFGLTLLMGAAPGGGDRIVAGLFDTADPLVPAFVLVSDDDGQTWRRTFDLPGDPNSVIRAIVDLGAGHAVAVMDGGHVWRTADAGETWTRAGLVPGALMDPEAPNPVGRVLWAKLGPDGRLYVGGTNLGRGIEVGFGWMLRSSVPLAVAGEATPEALDGHGLQLDARPNPASGAVTLTLTSELAERVRVEVVDASGRVVHETAEVWATASGTELVLPSERWAAGVYVARASVGRHTVHVTARFTVVR